jgi:hypothetical protein
LTPVMLIRLLLNSASPRATASRASVLASSSSPSPWLLARFAQAAKSVKTTGLNEMFLGFCPSGSLIPR